MFPPTYRLLRIGNDLVHALESIPREWVVSAWGAAGRVERRGIRDRTLPDGGAAVLKVYRPRSRHGWWRRFRTSRAIREGDGYRAFRARDLVTPLLLLYGERRRAGLWDMAAVATRRLDALPVSEVYVRAPDAELLRGAASVLAKVHRAELAHGDPRLRNFLATGPLPTPFDLPSWGRLTGPSQTRDLTRFLGSSRVLTGDDAMTRELLECYLSEGPRPAAEVALLLAAASAYAEEKGVP